MFYTFCNPGFGNLSSAVLSYSISLNCNKDDKLQFLVFIIFFHHAYLKFFCISISVHYFLLRTEELLYTESWSVGASELRFIVYMIELIWSCHVCVYFICF